MCRRETTRAPAFQQHWQESQYPWQSVSLPTIPPSPSLSPSLWSPRRSEKERQTHFHTNGVRACSPGTQWNCKYFIFAWESRAITPWPLSPLFHSVSSFTFFLLFLLSYLLTSAIHHAYAEPLRLHLSFALPNHPSDRITSIIFIALQSFTTCSVKSKITLLQSWTQFTFPMQHLRWF